MLPKKITRPAPRQSPATVEVVNPIWLLKAMALVIVAAMFCGYVTLCLLFYQGQWQLILHPTRTTQPLAELPGLPSEPVHFDAADTGAPRLSGLWIPAPAISRYPKLTVLYLRSGETSLSQSQTDANNLSLLHDLGLSVFAFDYRGFGQSDPTRPNQTRMTEDAGHAFQYLTESRGIAATNIILYGNGLGASLATKLAVSHGGIAAVILDDPGPRPIETALADQRVRPLPVHLLFHEDFSLSALRALKTPKLLISYPTADVPVPVEFRNASDPKTTLELVPGNATPRSRNIARFLDQVSH